MTKLTTLTELQILYLAYNSALDNWGRERERLDHNPGNPYTEARWKKWDARLNELHALILDRERNA